MPGQLPRLLFSQFGQLRVGYPVRAAAREGLGPVVEGLSVSDQQQTHTAMMACAGGRLVPRPFDATLAPTDRSLSR